MQSVDLSVVIITKNEAANLERCFASLPKGAELIVVDSGSDDETVSIARAAGARVETRAFADFATQKNYAMSLATRGWLLSLDADEALAPDLCQDILRLVASPKPSSTIYRLRRQLIYMGKALRFGKTIDFPARLCRRGSSHFAGQIHEKLLGAETAPILSSAAIAHYSYMDLEDYFRRFNSYTSTMAKRHFQAGKRVHWLPLVCRPWLEFVGRYILRLGFLDGYAGYNYAINSSLYAFTKYAKLYELQQSSAKNKGEP